MVSTIKFSEFAAANLNDSTNKSVGLSGGANASTEIVVRWTTSTRPSAPFNGILGYNTDLSQYEYWDSVTMDWFQLGTGDTGTVTLVNTGTGLTGGPITDTGTISFASIAAKSLWANVTSGAAVPTVVALTALVNEILPTTTTPRQMLQSQNLAAPVWSTTTWPATSTINQILYSSSNNVIGEIATAANAVMSTSAGGLPGFSTVLPSNLTTTDPVLTQGIATKHYVDQTALNGTSVYAASAASLGTVTQSGAGVGATLTNAGVQAALDLDGVAPPVGVNVLIKDTAVGMTAANEGIYTVTDAGSGATNWVLTRATGYDTTTEINNTGLILVQNGSTLAGTAWYNTATIVTVDTTAFNFAQFGNIIFPVTLAQGGTGDALVASQGSVVYGTATAMAFSAVGSSGQIFQSTGTTAPGWTTATYPSVATGTGTILRADGTNWIASTATFANTYGASELLYSNGANTVTGLATANNGVLVTSAGGVPSISSNLPAAINLPSPFSVNSTSVTTTGTQLNYLNALTAVPINKVTRQIFTANGTYTPTTGMVYCIVEVVGGGGGGGGSAGAVGQAGAAGAGGGGAYACSVITAATIGASQAVTIGSVGTGGAAGTNNGNAGNTCSLGALVSGGGGGGGVGSASSATITIAAGGSGSATATGDLIIPGGSGLAGFTFNGASGACVAGAGGATPLGYGGRGRSGVGNGFAGTGYGAGGAGGVGFNGTTAAGGDGAPGVVIITEFLSS